MGFFWRKWNSGNKSGVSGWDPFSAMALYMVIFLVGAACLLALPQQRQIISWRLAILLGSVFAALVVVTIVTARYHLVISRQGYCLWRTWFLIFPCYVRHFPRNSTIWVADDWGNDDGLEIFDPENDSGEIVGFGTNFGCWQALQNIHMLAYESGLREVPPGEYSPATTSPTFGVPNVPPRVKRLMRRKPKTDGAFRPVRGDPREAIEE
jgi:hypothetical protein